LNKQNFFSPMALAIALAKQMKQMNEVVGKQKLFS
jgi:hypothetical protein